MTRPLALALTAGALLAPAAAAASTSVDYGPISHSGMKNAGAAPPGLKLSLQIGLIANQSGIQNAVKAASNPSSSSYGKYPSLSTLQKNWGASSSVRNGVINAFKPYGVTAKIDVTHLRASATVTIKVAQKLFGVKWDLYETTSSGEYLALPVSTPKLASGLKNNVDTVSGLRLEVTPGTSRAHPRAAPVQGGTPTRTGTPDTGCVPTMFPGTLATTSALFPNQVLTAYGIAALQSAGLKGGGSKVAIVGEAPTVANDVTTFRNCFGLAGTALAMHGDTSARPILESSLDAMVISMVAPKLAQFDLYAHTLNENADDGDVDGFLQMLAQPLQATENGASLPNVISVSYGECEATVKPYTASRTLVERQLAATAALGITTVVAAGDSGSSACAHGVPTAQLTSADKQQSASWPATSPWVLAVGGTNITLTSGNDIAATGPWNDTTYPAPYTHAAGGGGGISTFETRPWWQPAQSFESKYRMVPDVAAFADESPGYAVVCSSNVQSCGPTQGQTIIAVGGTSAAAPLVAGMIALWDQKAHNAGLPRPGFVAPLLYTLAGRGGFVDITGGSNIVFSGVKCCTAAPGFDLTSGIGSPLANVIAGQLKS